MNRVSSSTSGPFNSRPDSALWGAGRRSPSRHVPCSILPNVKFPVHRVCWQLLMSVCLVSPLQTFSLTNHLKNVGAYVHAGLDAGIPPPTLTGIIWKSEAGGFDPLTSGLLCQTLATRPTSLTRVTPGVTLVQLAFVKHQTEHLGWYPVLKAGIPLPTLCKRSFKKDRSASCSNIYLLRFV